MGVMKALATPRPDRGAFTDTSDPRFTPSCTRCWEGFLVKWARCCSCKAGRKRAYRMALATAADKEQEERAMAARGRRGGFSVLGELLR